MKFEFPNVPVQVLPILKRQLESFGARVEFDSPTSGRVNSIAGNLAFSHVADKFTVEIIQEFGHFPRSLLIGGIRQHVEEACEVLRLGKAAHA